MKFVGSKRRVATPILEYILDNTSSRDVYVEPFCGGLNSFQVIAPHFHQAIAADSHKDLIDMWVAFQNGWTPRDNVLVDDYYALKGQDPSPDRTFAGYCSSFGSKWWGGFARSAYNRDNPERTSHKESARSLEKVTRPALAKISDLRFIHASYDQLAVPDGAVVYCDPPYEGTLGYRDKFDHDGFWKWARVLSDRCTVLVSEYQAPNGFTCVLEMPTRLEVSSPDRRGPRTERLFHWTGYRSVV